ncbi:RodZ domain-containing protein [Alteromonas sp. AMM-1]|uniref:RodZ domain-containing protein n=1 Tax=Alteromonas sp. AMM-1 TaxID=3394233 RepID=UPI0039A57BA9
MDKEQLLEADEQHVPATPSPGQVLREAREKLGLSQQAIADKLFLRVNIISDLEDNRLDENTSVTFIKGYVRLYAKNVGLKSEELISLFEKYHTAPKPPAKLQSFSKRVAKQAHDDRWMMVTYIIAIILLAGVVVWWYQQPANETDFSSTTTPTTAVPKAKPAANNQYTDTQTGDDSGEANEFSDETDNTLTYTEDEIASPESANDYSGDSAEGTPADYGLSVDTDTDQPVETQSESIPEVTTIGLTFTFTNDCWVNVTDSTGEALAFGIKAKGYVMSVSGIPPFEVTLGAPHVVQIDYDGDAVDMSGFDPKRTAKFYLPMQEQ